MHHYVYRVTSGKRFYIGVRSSKKRPELDTKYLGSGNYILFQVKFIPPVKEILSVHETRDEAQREETRLLCLYIGHRHCMNRKKTRCRKYANV